jgi:cephalosporin hydroxylase
MPLARTYDSSRGKIVTTVHDGYLDRVSRWSDIQEYLPLFRQTARSYPQARILELGTRKGNSTLAFLAGAEAVNGHVWSGDITDVIRDPDPRGMISWRDIPGWTFICGDDTDPAVQAQFPLEVDVFFLDTSHEYEHTLQELRTFMPRVVKGGTALFHDTLLVEWPGHKRSGDTPPVAQALDDYCAEAGLSWENIPGQFGLGVIRP